MNNHQSLAYSPDTTVWLDDAGAEYLSIVNGLCTIRDVARRYGITERALRFYEAKGLLMPQRAGSCRRCGAKELGRPAMLLQAKRLGFTLAEIRQLLLAQTANGALDISRRQCVEQIKLLELRKREIETALAELRRTYSTLYVRLATGGG